MNIYQANIVYMLTKNQQYLLKMIGSFESPVGATQLVKAVFLEEAQAERAEPKYDFYRWYFGPYSKDITRDLETLVERGEVMIERKRDSIVYRSKFKSTEFCEIANVIEAHTKDSLKDFLKKLYDKFDVNEMEMGQVIKFDSSIKNKADAFLIELRNT